MKRGLMLVVAMVSVVGLAAQTAYPSATHARAGGLASCGKVADISGPSKVSAANVPCGRALNVAAKFIQRDRVAEGWKPFNPAGCEWLMFKKRDKREFQDWVANGGRIHFKLIGFTKMRGCVS
jgi:hypothetical protein